MIVLAIDNNHDNLKTLKAVVADRLPDAKVLTAPNDPKGLELAREEDPDVILLDLVMPGMNGYEVCRQLKADERLCAVPVVFLTAQRTDRESRVKALEAGAEGFLTQPLDEIELTAQIRAMVKIKAANRQQRQEKEQLAALVADRTRVEQELAEHKRSEEEMARSRALLRIVVDLVPAYICAKNREGRFLLVNQRLADFYGMPVDTMTGMLHADLCEDEEELRGMLTADREVFASGKLKLIPEETMKKPDGSTIVLETYKIPFTAYDEPAVLIASADITERKRAENALRESEKRYRMVFESILDVYAEVALDGTILEISPAITAFSGYTREEVLGRSLTDFYANPEQRSDLLERLRKDGYANDYEVVLRNKAGQEVICSYNVRLVTDASGKPVKSVGTMRDITRRKRAEEALRESEVKFAKAFQTSPYAITITRLKDGKFIEVNDAFIAMTGFTREETIADSSVGLKLWVNEEDRQDVVTALREGRAVTGQEYSFRIKNGVIITGLFSAQRIKLSHESCILSSIQDISERKRVEEKLREQMGELKRWFEVTLGREGRIGELKREVNALAARLGQPPPYGTPETVERKESG